MKVDITLGGSATYYHYYAMLFQPRDAARVKHDTVAAPRRPSWKRVLLLKHAGDGHLDHDWAVAAFACRSSRRRKYSARTSAMASGPVLQKAVKLKGDAAACQPLTIEAYSSAPLCILPYTPTQLRMSFPLHIQRILQRGRAVSHRGTTE